MIEIITVVLAFLMLVATGVYVYYTKQLLSETIKLREVETSPFIGANLEISPGLSRIVIKNIGNSPAYNLKIIFDEVMLKEIREDLYREYEAEIEYFGVEQYIDIPFHSKKLFDKNIQVTCNYQSKEGKDFTENIILGLKSLSKLNIEYPKLPYEDILNNIGKQIEKLEK